MKLSHLLGFWNICNTYRFSVKNMNKYLKIFIEEPYELKNSRMVQRAKQNFDSNPFW